MDHQEHIPTNQFTNVYIYKPECQYWLYYQKKSRIQPLLSISTATTVNR